MPVKILSVDDSRTIRLIVAKTFLPYDVVLIEAANGEDGLAAITRETPDLVILDVTMPVMDGPTMLAALRADLVHAHTPVIMLTAESGRDNILQLSRLGCHDYLVKPFKPELLLEKAGRIVTLVKRMVTA